MIRFLSRPFVVLMVVGFLAVGLVSCDLLGDDDDDKPAGGGRGTGVLTYQGEDFAVTQLWFIDYGESDPGVYNVDLFIMTNNVGINFDGGVFTGSGKLVYLEMFFDTASVKAGTYNWSTSEAAGTFSDGSDITTVVSGVDDYDDLISGVVVIGISGGIYTISGEVATANGPATFTYEGPLTGSFNAN